ncbi:MAG: hypothetical protein RLZZ142_452 [Verrucomicrobiota bacterium]
MSKVLLSLLLSLVSASALRAQTPGSPVPSSPVSADPAQVPAAAGNAVPAGSGGDSAATPPAKPLAAAKISYSSCNVEGPYVAMTFDDGPHAQNTPRLLDILKQRGIRATFFVVGQNAAEYPEILKRTAAEGHELASHSYTHPQLTGLGEGGLSDQMEKTHQAVLRNAGVTMKVMRPPYGALSENQRRWVFAHYGYRVILWDVDPLDWKYRDAARVEKEILQHTRAGSIILAHDIHKSTVDAMASTLDALLAKGFKFVTVSELLAMDRPAAPKAGAVPAKTGATEGARESSGNSGGNSAGKESRAAAVSKKALPEGQKSPLKKTTASPEEVRQKWMEIKSQR